MKKKYFIYGIILIILLCAAYLFVGGSDSKGQNYTFAEITRGDLNVIIISTGTLEAMSTVEVGTQVSGRIDKLFVDFNSEVKKGQLLALLDTVSLSAQVRDQIAGLERAKALYNQAIAVHERNKSLYEKSFISELDFIESQTNVESAKASLKSAESSLERAKTNLDYAFIYAPIDGKIINRNVEEGQTVAASLSAPTLFTIAEDLSSMRILASVDESDIGQIEVGQKVKFTVQAYSDKNFDGEVTQIRLSPNVVQNVVNYTVVVKADNKEKLLLPGMTATVDFYVDQRDGVLLIPNVALRFQPSETMIEEYRKNMEKKMANMPDSVKTRFQQSGGQSRQFAAAGNSSNGQGRKNMNRVWFIDKKGNLKMSPIIIGLTDGKNTEVVKGKDIVEGMRTITAVLEDNSSSSNTNVFNPAQQNMPRGMRGF